MALVPVKRSEGQLRLAIVAAREKGVKASHIVNLEKTLERKLAEKKTGRILAAHKRWATIKTNRAAVVEAASAL